MMFSEYGFAMVVSFFSGVMGYSIVKFWLIPIYRYRKKKSEMIRWVKSVGNSLSVESVDGRSFIISNGEVKRRHRVCSELHGIFEYEIPYWYKLYLQSRSESPKVALESLSALGRTKEIKEQKELIIKIKQAIPV